MLTLIKKLFTSGHDSSDSLSRKTAKGSFWLLVSRIFDQSLGFISTIVLARILAPSDFGLFGITLIAASLLDTFSQTGFQPALVHKKGDIKPYLDTSFMVQAGRGLLIALIVFVSAPYIAMFFNVPAAVWILRVIGFAIFIQGLENIATIYLSKELDFKKYFIYQISGTLAKFLVSVILAMVLHNVWALVIGYLAGTTLRCIVSYIVYLYRPRLSFDIKKAKELFRYGKWVSTGNMISFFVGQVDNFFVAKVAGVASLGFYEIAYKIQSVLNMEVLTAAAFPAYSKIQDDREKLREAYLKIIKLAFIILAPMCAGIVTVAPAFLTFFLGAKWLPAVWPLRILSVSVSLWMLAVVSNYMFLAIGKPSVTTKWIFIKLVILVALLYPMTSAYGTAGAAISVLIGSLVAISGVVFQALRTLSCGFGSFIKTIIFSFFNALLMALAVHAVMILLPQTLWSFFAAVLSGVLVYFLLTLLSDALFNNGAIRLIKSTARLLT